MRCSITWSARQSLPITGGAEIKRVPVEGREWWISPPLRRLSKSPPSQSGEDCQLRRGKASLIARGHKKSRHSRNDYPRAYLATHRSRRKRHCCTGVLVVVAEVAGKSPGARNQRPEGARRRRRQLPKDRRPAPGRCRSAVWCLACFFTILSAAANSAIPNPTTATSGARPPNQQ